MKVRQWIRSKNISSLTVKMNMVIPYVVRGGLHVLIYKCAPRIIHIHIEVNENNIPFNILEFIFLGSYLGVIDRVSVLAPIAFSDWRKKGIEPYKKRMLAEVEVQACDLIAEESLTLEDGNIESNERIFSKIMRPEHHGRVRMQGFGVIPTRYFPNSNNDISGDSRSNFSQIASLK